MPRFYEYKGLDLMQLATEVDRILHPDAHGIRGRRCVGEERQHRLEDLARQLAWKAEQIARCSRSLDLI